MVDVLIQHCAVPRNTHNFPLGRSLENLKGWRGVSKAKVFKVKYEAKLRVGGVGVKPKNSHGGSIYGNFWKHHLHYFK